MKNTLLLLASLVLTTAGAALAQAPATTTSPQANEKARSHPSPTQKADRKASKMAKALGLNADQEARVEQLLLARQQEVAALKTKYGTDKKAGRADLKAAHDRYQAQLKTILTPEQYTKFNQLKEERHDHGKKKAKANP
ncbi:hypothetical protein IC235_06725 [Hymenobacter sp. BT664]|uniref:DUF4890 domain-containing protein n=1 Tax=Hymenobacter montanus TaxID=2771359 RepID=A0A927BCI6_9BACT|nr:hypothetical protein [Hymenobacter montanus]MBD2767583.1 hypothetical protein [Hymenobacter montanus]